MKGQIQTFERVFERIQNWVGEQLYFKLYKQY